MRERVSILGSSFDLLPPELIYDQIEKQLASDKKRLSIVVTAYSEFFVAAKTDSEFRKVLEGADWVTPDGVSVLASIDYEWLARKKNLVSNLLAGFKVGWKVIRGRYKSRVLTGVEMFESLSRLAGQSGYRVFLLGAKPGVVKRAEAKLKERYPGIEVVSDEGEIQLGTDKEKNEEVIKKINSFKTDILFVAYGPIRQEKWLFENKDRLKAKIGVGVGGTFDEFVGDFAKAPKFFEQHGLKWLWRLWVQPMRFKRIWNAVVVFPWLVFLDSLD